MSNKILLKFSVYLVCILSTIAIFTASPSLADDCSETERVPVPYCLKYSRESRAVPNSDGAYISWGATTVTNTCSEAITLKWDVPLFDTTETIASGRTETIEHGNVRELSCCPRYSRCDYTSDLTNRTSPKVLTYGGIYHIKNQDGTGTYLDTRKRGCEDNAMCVSTSYESNRDSGSGEWKILPGGIGTALRENKPVSCNDIVILQNQYLTNSNPTYLNTKNSGCEGNALCVSTTFESSSIVRDDDDIEWKIICSGGDISQPVSLQSQQEYNGQYTYLDTRSSGCEDNVYCVSTSYESNRHSGSGKWAFETLDGLPTHQLSTYQYGDIFYVKNQYPYNGQPTYLDVRQSGCENNALCVSTSDQADRRPGTRTGQWKIISAEGKTGTMQCGDIVHLANQYIYRNPTYLDVRGAGCEGNAFCVSTSDQADRRPGTRTGQWKIMCPAGDITQPIWLANQYIYSDPTYLDARGAGCEDNIYCVSTSLQPNRNASKGSGLWRLEPVK